MGKSIRFRYLLIGILIGMAIASQSAFALRTARPPEFFEWNTNTFTQLNQILLELWSITNGRYTVDITTSDPDGSRRCSTGEILFYDAGTDEFCVCVNGSTKDWNCATIN